MHNQQGFHWPGSSNYDNELYYRVSFISKTQEKIVVKLGNMTLDFIS